MSAFYDLASLVVVPSGYKTSKIYAQKPLTTDGQLAFTRSNDTATRVGPDGLIEKVRTNLALRSQSFATSAVWATTNGTVTDNAGTAPDGSTTASKIVATDADPFCYQSLTLSGQVTTSSYVKGIGSSIGKSGSIRIGGVSTVFVITGDWQRVSVTTTVAGAANYGLETPEAAAVSDEVLLWGFQVEYGDIATDYIATTSAAVSVGPVANVPRLDYLGSSCPRLLLEPQRTNLVTFSEQLDNSNYTKVSTNVTSNATTAPDGYLSADKIIATSASSSHSVYQTIGTIGDSAAISCFVKKAEYRYVNIQYGTAATRFDFDTLTFSGGTNNAYFDYGNGWYRISSVLTAAVNARVTILIPDNSGNVSYVGDNVSGTFVWGLQVESAATYATSYIPTLGAAVTRGADACSKTGISSLIGQTEGTLFFEFQDLDYSFASIARGFSISDGTYDNRIYIAQLSSGAIYCVAAAGGASNMEIQEAAPAARRGTIKAALAYKNNDFVLYVNGTLAGSDTSSGVPACSNLYLGQEIGLAANSLNKPYNQALLFKTRLSNTALAELTTI